jgi:hypothetical protein
MEAVFCAVRNEPLLHCTLTLVFENALKWLRQLVPAAKRTGPSSVPGQCMWK